MWTSLVPCLLNFALVWDPVIVYSFTKTQLYSDSTSKLFLLGCLVAWIYFTKLIKLMGYFKDHPVDFLLFFFPLPAYHLFAYFHSLVKFWTVLTFWDCTWSGRPIASTTQGQDEQNAGADDGHEPAGVDMDTVDITKLD